MWLIRPFLRETPTLGWDASSATRAMKKGQAERLPIRDWLKDHPIT
jgi:hypothetical protein